jgi:hypothetical protein
VEIQFAASEGRGRMIRDRVHLTAEVTIYVFVALFALLLVTGYSHHPDEQPFAPPGAPADPCRGERPGACAVVTP